MENDPKSPTLETSTITMEKDLEDAVNYSLSDNESFVITEGPELDSSSKGRGSSTPDIERLSLSGYSEMTQSKYAQV